MQSIFDGIVKNENDHTRLLANLAERHPQILSGLLGLFSGGKAAKADAKLLSITTQQVYKDSERTKSIPDVSIKGDGITCYLEIKIQSSVPLSDAQKSAYQKCFRGKGERYFCLLVPSVGDYLSDLPAIKSVAAADGIQVHYLTWTELINYLEQIIETLDDNIANEALAFFKRSFQLVTWTQQQKVEIMNWSSERFLAIRKLEKVIEQTKVVAAGRGYVTEGEYYEPASHGFYLRSGKDYPVWIGAWSVANQPISLAVNTQSREAVSAAAIDFGESSLLDTKWKIYPIEKIDWSNPESLWARIEELFPTLLRLVNSVQKEND